MAGIDDKQQKPVILIVEDHDALRDSLKSWLSSIFQDCAFLQARSAEEALERISVQPPDIVLMDMMLPMMNGIEAARRIRETVPEARTIILSIYENHDYHSDAQTAGVYAYIPKRKMGTELVPVITELLSDRGKNST